MTSVIYCDGHWIIQHGGRMGEFNAMISNIRDCLI